MNKYQRSIQLVQSSTVIAGWGCGWEHRRLECYGLMCKGGGSGGGCCYAAESLSTWDRSTRGWPSLVSLI